MYACFFNEMFIRATSESSFQLFYIHTGYFYFLCSFFCIQDNVLNYI